MRAYAQHVENHDGYPDRNRRVGHVESPEVIFAPVDIDEVDDVADEDAVDEVARGAADDQGEAYPGGQLMAGQTRRVDGDANQPGARDNDDEGRLVGKIGAVQDAKGRSRVADVREVDQARDDSGAGMEVERPPD